MSVGKTSFYWPKMEVQNPDRSRELGAVSGGGERSLGLSPAPWSEHRRLGSVPRTKASLATCSRGHPEVATSPVLVSTSTNETPGGGEKSPSGMNGELHFKNCPHSGAAAAPPVMFIGVLSSNPTQTPAAKVGV